MSRFMITIMGGKNDFIVCEGTKERLPAHHKKKKKNTALSQYDGGTKKPQHVNYVHFISDITIRKNG